MAKRTRAGDPAATYADDQNADTMNDTSPDSPYAGSSSQSQAGSNQPAGDASSESHNGASSDDLMQSAKEAAGHVVEQVKGQASSRVDQQRQTVASGFEAVARAFRSMGDDLRRQDQGPVSHYAAEFGHAVSGQVDRIAAYLRGRDINQLMNDAEDVARRSPAMFLGGAFAIGFLATRFLKSSRPMPDFLANMPDPNRALPPASSNTPGTVYSADPDPVTGI